MQMTKTSQQLLMTRVRLCCWPFKKTKGKGKHTCTPMVRIIRTYVCTCIRDFKVQATQCMHVRIRISCVVLCKYVHTGHILHAKATCFLTCTDARLRRTAIFLVLRKSAKGDQKEG